MHLAEADGTNGETPWSDALVTGTTDWDWVLLQDQSQIPGFPADNSDYLASVAALGGLDALVAGKNGQSVLLMTWGRLHGDANNPDRYPDYPTMQDLLATGYSQYAASITTTSRTAWIAPAGLAWRHIYDAQVAAGADPLAPGNLFYSLYFDDGSHPSALGTYLTACVIYATITGQDPTGLPAPDTVPAAVVPELQDACAATVFHETPDIAYPWQEAQDTGSTDTGPTDTGSPDTGSPDTSVDSGVDTSPPTDSSPKDSSAPDDTGGTVKTGCGCATDAGPGSPWIGVAAVFALAAQRRRERPTRP